MSPSASQIGAALSEIWCVRPLREISTVWLAGSSVAPVRRIDSTGFATTSRVTEFTMKNTSASGRPDASSIVQSVIRSAVGYICETQPCTSVVITATPIECNVVDRVSSLLRSRSCAVRRSVTSWCTMTAPPMAVVSGVTVIRNQRSSSVEWHGYTVSYGLTSPLRIAVMPDRVDVGDLRSLDSIQTAR